MATNCERVKNSCRGCVCSTLTCDTSDLKSKWKPYTFAVLAIISLGLLLSFILATTSAIQMSYTETLFTGLGAMLAGGILLLDCCQKIGCHTRSIE